MRQWIGSHLTFANVVSLAALFVALGGTATAVTYVVSSNSQIGPGTVSGHKPPSGKHSNIITGSVNGQDVADGSLHGADIDESTLGNVPSAAKANDAFSTFHDGELAMPDTISAPTQPIGDLSIPHAGNYVINATLWTLNHTATASYGKCVLAAGGDSDTQVFESKPGGGEQTLALQVVHTFSNGALATLSCTDNAASGPSTGTNVSANNTKITAIQVNNLTNSGF